MTDYAVYVYPFPEFHQQTLTGSLDDGLDRWDGFAAIPPDELMWTFVDLTHNLPSWLTSNHNVYVFPEWSTNLFGHILIIPSRLDLGNILTNQSRTIEIANLFLTPQEWRALSTNVEGLVFVNPPPGLSVSPFEPYLIPSFGSYLLEVSISADGPPAISGSIDFEFESEDVSVPVTGTRVVVLPFMPRPGVIEILQFSTDVMEAYDGTEMRAGIREAPRQNIKLQFILDTSQDRLMRGLLFDWIARVFAVPVFWEARAISAPVTAGSLIVNVDTTSGDFRVGELVMLWTSNEVFTVAEIDTLSATQITVTSQIGFSYPVGTLAMPVRKAFAKTVPAAGRITNNLTQYSLEFVTIDNVDLSDATGEPTYQTKVILECNLAEGATGDSFDRPVTVIDNESGQIYQTSRVDRSHYRTTKVWDAPDMDEVWRIRQLAHYFGGSRRSFWMPAFRDDMTVTEDIGGAATTFRINAIGFTSFYRSRRPFGDVRMTLKDGSQFISRVIDSEVEGSEEVLTIDVAFASYIITPDMIDRVEFMMLMRVSDDEVTFTHRRNGDATVSMNLVSVKE